MADIELTGLREQMLHRDISEAFAVPTGQPKELLAEIDASIETTPPPANAGELLSLARSLIEDNLLTPEQLKQLQECPSDFLRSLVADPLSAEAFNLVADVKDALAKGYFQSLLAKASEGEKYDEARLKKALLKAQVSAVEALEGELASATLADKLNIAHMLKD